MEHEKENNFLVQYMKHENKRYNHEHKEYIHENKNKIINIKYIYIYIYIDIFMKKKTWK